MPAVNHPPACLFHLEDSMLVRATKCFNFANSPMPIFAGELIETNDELGQSWIVSGRAEKVKFTELGIVPFVASGDIAPLSDSGISTVVEEPGVHRRSQPRKR
jgi:hypothetical protein